jgi:hypothetical protein
VELSSGNFICDITDHFANFVLLKSKLAQKQAPTDRPLTRIFSQKNKNVFSSELSKIDWNTNLYQSVDASMAFENFTTILQDTYNKSFPVVKMSKKAAARKGWINANLQHQIANKNKLYRKWVSTRSAVDKDAYLSVKRVVSKLVKNAEVNYYHQKFNNRISDSKYVWSEINKVCSYKKT